MAMTYMDNLKPNLFHTKDFQKPNAKSNPRPKATQDQKKLKKKSKSYVQASVAGN